MEEEEFVRQKYARDEEVCPLPFFPAARDYLMDWYY